MAAPKPMTRESLEQRHPGLHARLGKDSDSELARRHGISRQRVAKIRESLGVPTKPASASEEAHVRSQVMSCLRGKWEGTSAGLAVAMNTTSQTMSGWCSGKRVPTLETLISAADHIGFELRVTPYDITVVDRAGKVVQRFDGAVI